MRIGYYIAIFLLFSTVSYAQIQFGYLDHQPGKNNFRTTGIDSTQINIPVWDDFSTSSLFPDTLYWQNSDNVSIQSGIGINPPSVNVAVFDGADQFGNPYSSTATEEGIGDSLVSRFIDLSGANQNNTYLSFYYQKEGRGELPDENDFLRVLLKRDDNTWDEVWKATGNDLAENDEFFFQLIKLDSTEYFHEYFQFKFESFGRLSGAFDTWNVDYVYLNDKRRGERLDLSDHTLVTTPSSLLGQYTNVPYDQFISDPSFYLGNTSFDIANIEGQVTPIEASVLIYYQDGNTVIDTINLNEEYEDLLDPFETITFSSDSVSPSAFTGLSDSLFLSTFVYIDTGDTIDIVNLRVNDTIRTDFNIFQELSYDDGAAEFSAGLNSFGGQIAYQFYTPVEDQISGVKIYFPKISTAGAGNSFNIKVWNELNDDGNSEIFSQSAVRSTSSGINEFAFYQFNKAVTVKDTFYIGYEQRSEGLFVVGYDKNTSSGDKIFFNTGSSWEPNTDLEGSLMIRPVFGDAQDIVTGLVEPETSFVVYPNPSDGVFRIRGSYVELSLFDSYGQKIDVITDTGSNSIDLSGQKKGIYFLKVFDGKDQWVKKLILQ